MLREVAEISLGWVDGWQEDGPPYPLTVHSAMRDTGYAKDLGAIPGRMWTWGKWGIETPVMAIIATDDQWFTRNMMIPSFSDRPNQKYQRFFEMTPAIYQSSGCIVTTSRRQQVGQEADPPKLRSLRFSQKDT